MSKKIIGRLCKKTNLKLKDIKLDNSDVLSLFQDPKVLAVTSKEILRETGTLGLGVFDNFELEYYLTKEKLDSIKDLEVVLSSFRHSKSYNYEYKEDKNMLHKCALNAYYLGYFKLYYPLEFYQELIENYHYEFKNIEVFTNYESIKKRLLELNNIDIETLEPEKLSIEEYHEKELLELFLEITVRKIKVQFLGKCFFNYEVLINKNNKTIIIKEKSSDNKQKNHFDIIASKPLNGKVPFILNLIMEYVDKQKGVVLYSLNSKAEWYIAQLLARNTKVSCNIIKTSFNPCSSYAKINLGKLPTKVIDEIEKLKKKELLIYDNKFEKLNYLIENIIYNYECLSDLELVVIDNLDGLIKDTNEALEKVLKTLMNLAYTLNIKLVLLMNANLERDTKDLREFKNLKILKKYVDTLGLVYIEKIKDSKVENIIYNYWKKDNDFKTNKTLKMKYDRIFCNAEYVE